LRELFNLANLFNKSYFFLSVANVKPLMVLEAPGAVFEILCTEPVSLAAPILFVFT
jgi:hypothetical protein